MAEIDYIEMQTEILNLFRQLNKVRKMRYDYRPWVKGIFVTEQGDKAEEIIGNIDREITRLLNIL